MNAMDYLYKSDFYIRAELLEDGNGLKVTYPEICIFNHKYSKQDISYKIVEDGIEISGKNIPTRVIKCSEYANRMIIWSLILRKCLDMDINPDLLLIIKDENTVGQANELMTVMKEPKNRKKESSLVKIFLSHLAGEEMTKEANEVGVPRSYKLLRTILHGEN